MNRAETWLGVAVGCAIAAACWVVAADYAPAVTALLSIME